MQHKKSWLHNSLKLQSYDNETCFVKTLRSFKNKSLKKEKFYLKLQNILERLEIGEVIIGDGSYANTLEKRGYVKVQKPDLQKMIEDIWWINYYMDWQKSTHPTQIVKNQIKSEMDGWTTY